MNASLLSQSGHASGLALITALSGLRLLKKDEVLFRPGDPVDKVHLVQRGCIRLLASHGGGDTGVPGGTVTAGGFVDVAALFAQPARHFRGAHALTDCRLLACDPTLFRGVIREQPDLLLAMLAQLSREVEEQSDQARLLRKCGPCRFILFLLERLSEGAGSGENHLCLQESRKEIAQAIAVKHETVSRIITALIQDGHLRVREKGSRIITIPDVAALRAVMAACPRCVDAHGEARLSPGLVLPHPPVALSLGQVVRSRRGGVSSPALAVC